VHAVALGPRTSDPDRLLAAIAQAATLAGFPRGAFDPREWAIGTGEKEHYLALFQLLSVNGQPVPGAAGPHPLPMHTHRHTCKTRTRACLATTCSLRMSVGAKVSLALTRHVQAV
jgi:hypothetical protein